MHKKVDSYCLLRWCFLLISYNVFSQTEIYKSDFSFDGIKADSLSGTITISKDNILFNASNKKLYSIAKKEGKINWEKDAVTKSDIGPYLYNNTFFYQNYNNGVPRVAQFNQYTGEKIKDFPIESIITKPYFLNNIMYATVYLDGGKLIAYHLDENKIVWQQNIGFGAEIPPVYLKNKIIANAEDNSWFEIGYDGNFLKTESKKHTYLDTNRVFVKDYKFPAHDGKAITQDFLKKNKLLNTEYKIKTTTVNTILLSDKQLLILGDNKKKIIGLDLETLVSVDHFYSAAYSEILEVNQENVWFYYQNHLLNYDFVNSKLLRKVDLTKWNPLQIALENRTIWLLSGNNGQLYGLDFEPDQQTADKIEAIANHYKCTEPDPKKIEAMKAAQEKLKNNQKQFNHE